MAILKIPILIGLFLTLWSVLVKGEVSIVDTLAASVDESYTVKTEDKEYDNMNYTVHNYQFHDRDKRSIGASVQRLCVMTFNIQNFHSKKASKQNKAIAIANVSDSCNINFHYINVISKYVFGINPALLKT